MQSVHRCRRNNKLDLLTSCTMLCMCRWSSWFCLQENTSNCAVICGFSQSQIFIKLYDHIFIYTMILSVTKILQTKLGPLRMWSLFLGLKHNAWCQSFMLLPVEDVYCLQELSKFHTKEAVKIVTVLSIQID